MNNYIYCVKDENNNIIYREYRYEEAMAYYKRNENARKIYAYDKFKIKAPKVLIHWK